MSRNAGLPIVRRPKNPGDHEITTPELREWLRRDKTGGKLTTE